METWVDLPNWSGVYQISNLGRLRRIVFRIHNPNTTGDAYPRVALCVGGSKPKHVRLHILVAEAFLGPRPEGHVVNHKDGNKLNCKVDNLEWVTVSQNSIHAYDNGLSPSGESHCRAKLTEEDVLMIRRKYATGKYTKNELAASYSVHRRTITDILLGRSWKRV